MSAIKRAYEEPGPKGGCRYLVDRLWPRGLKKKTLQLDGWVKEVAPSEELRRWFNHDPERWGEFCRRYHAKLDEKPESWRRLLKEARAGDITLVYAAHDEKHNNAVALQAFLTQELEEGR